MVQSMKAIRHWPACKIKIVKKIFAFGRGLFWMVWMVKNGWSGDSVQWMIGEEQRMWGGEGDRCFWYGSYGLCAVKYRKITALLKEKLNGLTFYWARLYF